MGQCILGQLGLGRTPEGHSRNHRFLEPLCKGNTGYLDKSVLEVFQMLGDSLVEALATFSLCPFVIAN